MRTQQADGYVEPRDALAQAWMGFLNAALPESCWMYLPSLGAEASVQYCEDWQINGLIFTGGEDVGTSPLRDSTERSLLDWAGRNSIPLLGICRGMQLMTIVNGGTLQSVSGHVASRHILNGIYSHEVNSYHGQKLASCPPNYIVTAKADDGTIEGIRHTDLNWEGWMWHPEREDIFSPHDIQTIRRIFL